MGPFSVAHRALGRATLRSSSVMGYRPGQAGASFRPIKRSPWTPLALICLMLTIERGVPRPLETCLFRWKKEIDAA